MDENIAYQAKEFLEFMALGDDRCIDLINRLKDKFPLMEEREILERIHFLSFGIDLDY